MNHVLALISLACIHRSFRKGSQLFKIKYSRVEVFKDSAGNVNCIELGENTGSLGGFIHTCESLLTLMKLD